MVRSVLFVEFHPGHEEDLIREVSDKYQFLEIHVRSAENDAVVFLDSKDEETVERLVDSLTRHWSVKNLVHHFIMHEERSRFRHLDGKKQFAIMLGKMEAGQEPQGMEDLAGMEELDDVLYIDADGQALVTAHVRDYTEGWKLARKMVSQVRAMKPTESYVTNRSVAF